MKQENKYMIIYTFYDDSIELLYFDTLGKVLEYIKQTDKNLNITERKHKVKVYKVDNVIYKDTGIGQATRKELAELRKENLENEIA